MSRLFFEFHSPNGNRCAGKKTKICVLGDFAGNGVADLSAPIRVDLESVDLLMSKLRPTVSVNLAGREWQYPITSLEGFHPDRLLTAPGPLAALASLRKDLLNPTTAESAKQEAALWLDAPVFEKPTGVPSSTSAPPDDTFSRLLGGTVPEPGISKLEAPARSAGAFDSIIKSLVGNSPATAPQATATAQAVEAKLGGFLREILTNQEFQALEARWRGLELLLQHLDCDETEIVVCPCRRLSDALSQLLSDTFEEDEQIILVGLFAFGTEAEDIQQGLEAAGLARRLNTLFLAAAAPSLLGLNSFGELRNLPADFSTPAWNLLRSGPASAHLSLALPQFLLRLPYGAKTDPIESFPFEEYGAGFSPAHYLWGNPAILCAIDCVASSGGAVGPLPIHTDGANLLSPSTEAILPERSMEQLFLQGFTPILAIKNRNAVQIPRIQGITIAR